MSKPRRTIVHEGKFLRLVRLGRWEFAQRTRATGIVMIVPVTDDGKLLLIEQHRAPLDKWVIELPAGLAGDTRGTEGEPLVVAAKRELLEETGYSAARYRKVAHGPPSAGMSDEMITIFLATGLKKVAEPQGDGDEQISTHLVPLSRVAGWLRRRAAAGRLIDLKLWAGLYFAQQKRPKRPRAK